MRDYENAGAVVVNRDVSVGMSMVLCDPLLSLIFLGLVAPSQWLPEPHPLAPMRRDSAHPQLYHARCIKTMLVGPAHTCLTRAPPLPPLHRLDFVAVPVLALLLSSLISGWWPYLERE
jgi:hypothetical protein